MASRSVLMSTSSLRAPGSEHPRTQVTERLLLRMTPEVMVEETQMCWILERAPCRERAYLCDEF